MRHFVSAACSLWLAAAASVQAEPVVVVELYLAGVLVLPARG